MLGHERLHELNVTRVDRLVPVLGNESILDLSEVLLGEGLEAPRGCMVLTPTRLILAEMGTSSFKTTVHPWSRVSSIQLASGPLSATVRLASAGGPTVLTLPPETRGRWDGLAAHFHKALADGFSTASAQTPQAVPAASAPSLPLEVDCPYCGTRNDAAEKKCSVCSAALPRPVAAPTQPLETQQTAVPPVVSQPAGPKGPHWVVWIVGAIIGLSGLVVVALSGSC